jgi:hypothetical protein
VLAAILAEVRQLVFSRPKTRQKRRMTWSFWTFSDERNFVEANFADDVISSL